MKKILAIYLCSVLISCQKEANFQTDKPLSTGVTASDALTPLPCHTTSFSTNYATIAGQVPPFRFTKTWYADTRIKTINMLSRAFPNHSAFKNQAYELIGNFTYSTNQAKFIGTKETWEYFKTPTGGAGRRSLGKKAITYFFTFDATTGFCLRVGDTGYTYPDAVMHLFYGDPPKTRELQTVFVKVGPSPDFSYFYFKNDANGNNVGNYHVYEPYQNLVSYAYDYSKSGARYNYQPSQYSICFEYNLVEVMQWLPPSKNPRTSVSIQFYPFGNSTFVKQGQSYRNNVYDANNNLVSYSYGDNVLQKTTWFCK